MTLAITCVAYDSMAQSKGWPAGEILSKDASFPKIVAFITILWVLGKSFMVFQWWSPIVILILGWILSFILTITLKKNVQLICIPGVFPAFIATTLYISEAKPFGIFHNIFS